MLVQNEEARNKIIEIARNIFTHFGFKKTTMEEIAQASRKGKSSIYYYFSNKEEIFKAVIDKEVEELKSELSDRLGKTEDPVEKLKLYILVRMRKLNDLTNFYTALKSEYLSHLEFIEQIRKSYDLEEINTISGIIQEGIDRKLFIVDDPWLSAVAIVTAMKGLEVPLFTGNHQHDFELRINSLVNSLFYGIVKR